MNTGIILDMDGVIIDSNPYHKIAWTNFFVRRNVEVDDRAFHELIFGTTGDEAINSLLGNNFSTEELDVFNEEIDTEFRSIIAGTKNLKPVAGLLQFLKSVSGAGCKIALATSAPPENVELILTKLEILHYFNLIVDKTQVISGKPNPEIYLKTVQRLGLPKENCVVFEDSFAGITSARDAGLVVIGVTTSHSDQELIRTGATYCIRDFCEISLERLKESGIRG